MPVGSDAEYPPQFGFTRMPLPQGELMRRHYGANGAVLYAFPTAVADVAPDDELIGSFPYGALGTQELAHPAARAVRRDHEQGCRCPLDCHTRQALMLPMESYPENSVCMCWAPLKNSCRVPL